MTQSVFAASLLFMVKDEIVKLAHWSLNRRRRALTAAAK